MGSPGGYQVSPGLYRVPDLLTEDQFKDYMRLTYGVVVSFDHGDQEAPDPSAVLGKFRAGEVKENKDPTLRDLNTRSFGPEYASRAKARAAAKSTEDESTEKRTTPTRTTASTSTTTKK